jgi:tRNA (mo5U34)-methyltransferase
MLDEATLLNDLDSLGLTSWETDVLPLIRNRLANKAHGNLTDWKAVLDALPLADECTENSDLVREQLMKLAPWRKGPFDVCGITIDAEWRSDLKWRRLIDHLGPMTGRNVLDVGAGNGWYTMQMLKAGANLVIGIDPTVLFVVQFEAIRKLTGLRAAHVLPLRLEDLPPRTRTFDTTFSMGVLYHRRDPLAHLAELRDSLVSGGELILETLVLPGDENRIHEPEDRYARMRNVWHLPTIPALRNWIQESGFDNPKLIDVSTTTTTEQRSTVWMPFESLADALDPGDPGLTVEGLPAPTRAVFSCTRR